MVTKRCETLVNHVIIAAAGALPVTLNEQAKVGYDRLIYDFNGESRVMASLTADGLRSNESAIVAVPALANDAALYRVAIPRLTLDITLTRILMKPRKSNVA